ncbi:hypothetical protein MGYG_03493 [Nannizzia gypsea CBS 118893]|uniref:Uncharacterized protein n=1 Tax=Arthroderma gypseum (strain ATCC MYA-4604 / CBS 118893) TaxID=535722 RepID=E4US73_ARTGP|nr:hypothetical protein MGYG_03493 [Nannizzia gypsea CBS 118893]EFR00491.1 hypothetical protein MGYG_03493 [Nannizzia gypsea CBS 118893]
MPGLGSPNADYPEVNEYFPDFGFEKLAIPPPGYELYRFPDTTHLRNRALDIDTLKKLVNHHTWGFSLPTKKPEKQEGKKKKKEQEKKSKPGKPQKPQIPRKTKEDLLQVLKRISYNQDPRLRSDWHHFVSRDCDAGPRLLRPSYNPPLFSRRMPRGDPNWEFALPPETPQVPPQWSTPPRDPVFHRHHPGTNFPSRPSYMPAQFNMMAQSPTRLRQSPGYGVPNGFPNPGRAGKQWGDEYYQRYQTPSHNRIDGAPQFMPGQTGSPPRWSTSHSAYGLLNNHSPKQTPLAQLHYTKPSITGPIIGATTLSFLRLRVSEDQTRLSFDAGGELYPLRCRGPMSCNGSSDIFDCIIVSGLLTNAGSTTVDKRASRERLAVLTPPEKAFISAMGDCLNSQLSDEVVSTVKERLWDVYAQHYKLDPHSVGRLVMDPANIWTALTKSFRQFHLCYTDHQQPCGHHGGSVNSVLHRECVASLCYQLNDNDGVDLSVLLQRVFQGGTIITCAQCDNSCSRNYHRTFESAPLRLVIRPHQQTKIRNSCSPAITVRLTRTTGEVVNEQYKFIGGIHEMRNNGDTRHRLRWVDKDQEANGDRRTQIYDAGQISGMIPGGIKPQDQCEIAPSSWWVDGFPVLLFFENIIHPPKETLAPPSRASQPSQYPNLSPGHPSNGTIISIRESKNNGDSPSNKTLSPSKEKQPKPPVHAIGIGALDRRKTLVSSARRKPKPTSRPKKRDQFETDPAASNLVVAPYNANDEGSPLSIRGSATTPTVEASICPDSSSSVHAGTSTNGNTNSTVGPTPRIATITYMHPNYRPGAVPDGYHQVNAHQDIPNIPNAVIPAFNASAVQLTPNVHGSGPELAGSYQANTYEPVHDPCSEVTTFDIANIQHLANYVSSSGTPSNDRTTTHQGVNSPIIVDTPPEQNPTEAGNPHIASSAEGQPNFLTINPHDLLFDPAITADDVGLRPEVPVEAQVAEDGNADTTLIEGLVQGDLGTANLPFDDFIHHNDSLYSSNLALPYADSPIHPLPPSDNFLDFSGQVNSIGPGQCTAANMETALADNEWLAQWGITSTSTGACETSLTEDTAPEPSTGTDAAGSNSLKRKRDESESEQ